MSGARHRVFAANDASALREALEAPIGDYRAESAPAAPDTDVVKLIGDLVHARPK